VPASPEVLSWLISFFIVCKFWLNHHHLLVFGRHATYVMVWLNAILFMFQSFVLSPTALMGEYPTNPLPVSLFGVMTINTLLFIALQRYIMSNLVKPELLGEKATYLTPKSVVGVLSYSSGAAAAWFNLQLALVLYAITPLFFITSPRR
jgi:uncharacterized membrane protein